MVPKNELDKLEQRYRDNPAQWFAALADSYRKAGELELALEVVQSGIVDRPDYPSAQIVLGRVFLDMDRNADAAQAFQRVLQLDAENIIALKTLAEIAEREGDVITARWWLRRLLEVDPMNESAAEALLRLEDLEVEDDAVTADDGAVSLDDVLLTPEEIGGDTLDRAFIPPGEPEADATGDVEEVVAAAPESEAIEVAEPLERAFADATGFEGSDVAEAVDGKTAGEAEPEEVESDAQEWAFADATGFEGSGVADAVQGEDAGEPVPEEVELDAPEWALAPDAAVDTPGSGTAEADTTIVSEPEHEVTEPDVRERAFASLPEADPGEIPAVTDERLPGEPEWDAPETTDAFERALVDEPAAPGAGDEPLSELSLEALAAAGGNLPEAPDEGDAVAAFEEATDAELTDHESATAATHDSGESGAPWAAADEPTDGAAVVDADGASGPEVEPASPVAPAFSDELLIEHDEELERLMLLHSEIEQPEPLIGESADSALSELLIEHDTLGEMLPDHGERDAGDLHLELDAEGSDWSLVEEVPPIELETEMPTASVPAEPVPPSPEPSEPLASGRGDVGEPECHDDDWPEEPGFDVRVDVDEADASVPEPVVTSTMADVYAHQGLHREAREIYEQLLERYPDDPGLQRKLAELGDAGGPTTPPAVETSRFSVAHTGGASARAVLQRVFGARVSRPNGAETVSPSSAPSAGSGGSENELHEDDGAGRW